MSSIKKNFTYNVVYQLLNICLPLITIPHLTRTIGPDGMGAYSYAHSVVYCFMVFVLLGLGNYGSRKIAQERINKNQLSKVFWSIYAMQIFTGVMVCFVYIGYSIWMATDLTMALIMTMYVFSACIDITWFFNGMEEFKLTALRNAAVKLLNTVCLFVLVRDTNDTLLYCIIMSGGALITQLVLWPYVHKKVDFYRPSLKEVLVHIKPNLYLSITVIAVSIFKYMDKVMLGLQSTVEQVGYYEVSEKIIQVPIAFITALGTTMLPNISNLTARGEAVSGRILSRSVIFASFMSSAMCFGIMGVSREFIPLFYGPGYDVCVILYSILLPSCIFLAFANVIRTQYLLPNEKDTIYIRSTCAGALVNFIVNLVLISKLGSIGAAIGTLMAEFTVCLFQVWPVRKEIPIRKFILNSVPFLIAGIVMFLSMFLIDFGVPSIISLLCKVLIGVVVYGIIFGAQIKFSKPDEICSILAEIRQKICKPKYNYHEE